MIFHYSIHPHVRSASPISVSVPNGTMAFFRPRLAGGSRAAGEFRTPRGLLTAEWRKEGASVGLSLAVPAGMTVDAQLADLREQISGPAEWRRDWPHKKTEQPPGVPKLRTASAKEVQTAQRIKAMNPAA